MMNKRVFVATSLVAMLALTGCAGGSGPGEAEVTASPAAAPTVSDNATDTVGPQTGAPTRAPDLPVPTAIERVERPDSPVVPAMTVAPKKAEEPAKYSDGVVVTISDVSRGETAGQGPGVIVGQPTVSAKVMVRNDSKKTLDLETAVVSARYTDPSSQKEMAAQGTYTETTKDLSGMVKPGASVEAEYSFLVPSGATWRVIVDIDGNRTPAVFTAK